MSKSILVIDTPEGCKSCPYCRGQYSYHCKLMQFLDKEGFALCYVNHQVFRGGKPDWCPLQDFPKKKPKVEYQRNGCFGINEAMKNSFNMGFNSCIDEILKN